MLFIFGKVDCADVPWTGFWQWVAGEISFVMLSQVQPFSAERTIGAEAEVFTLDVNEQGVAIALRSVDLPEPAVLRDDAFFLFVGSALEASFCSDVEIVAEGNPIECSVDNVVHVRAESFCADHGVIIESRVDAGRVHINEALAIVTDVEGDAKVVNLLDEWIVVSLPA